MEQATTEKGYNGWKNYETWGVALVLDNDEGTYGRCNAYAEAIRAEAPDHRNVPKIWTVEEAARFEMADWLKGYVEELCGLEDEEMTGMPEPSLMARQLLGGALSDVDWDEVANHYLSALDESCA